MNTAANARPDRIVVVDDDARIRDLLRRYLTQEGFEVLLAEDAKALNRLLTRETVHLIVLDLMLPGEDGLSICRRLRAANDVTPIIMLTAKVEDVDRIVGLEVGADDYLPKPFNPRELLARIHAVLRRRPAIPFGGERLEFFARRLEERGMRHTERRKDVVGDVLFKPLPADALDDIAPKADAVVGISRNDAGWKQSEWLIADQEVAQRGDLVGRLLAVHQNDIANGFFEAPGMRHQISNGDGAAKRGANLEVEILIDIGVEIELALLQKLHCGDPGKKLGDGGQPEEGRSRINGLLVLEIRVAVALFEQQFAVLHDQDGGARDVGPFELERKDAVEEGFEVGRAEFMNGGRRRGRSLVAGGVGLRIGLGGGSGLGDLGADGSK